MANLPTVLYELLRELSKLIPKTDLQSLAALAGTNTAVAAKIVHHCLSIYRLLKKIPSLSVSKSVMDLVGNTPMLELQNFGKNNEAQSTLIAKLEYRNPGNSAADRLFAARFAAAEEAGTIQEHTTIIEAARPEEAISLAWLGASRGCKMIICMEENTPPYVQNRILAYGAELILDPQPAEKAEYLLHTLPEAVKLPEYSPSKHSKVHYDSTGPEIWNATQGKVDVLVGSAETPDILFGAGQFLKEKKEDLLVIAVRMTPEGASSQQELAPLFPADHPLLTIYDQVISVSQQDAAQTAADLARSEGLLVGPLSGANALAAVYLTHQKDFTGKSIAILFPDSGLEQIHTEIQGNHV